jgi:hypothetical protein
MAARSFRIVFLPVAKMFEARHGLASILRRRRAADPTGEAGEASGALDVPLDFGSDELAQCVIDRVMTRRAFAAS